MFKVGDSVNVLFNCFDSEFSINLKKINIVFGESCYEKNLFFNRIKSGFCGECNPFIINNIKTSKGVFDVFEFNEEDDFLNQFKFTKSNYFKNSFFSHLSNDFKDNIVKNINEELIKVNTSLNSCTSNYFCDHSVSLQVKINEFDDIVNKYTDIFIDDYSSVDPFINKGRKKVIMFKLLLSRLCDASTSTIIMFNSFDAYLNVCEIIDLLNYINDIKNKNLTFILFTNNPVIYKYTRNDYGIFKFVNDSLISFNFLSNIIFNYCTNFYNDFNISDDDIVSFHSSYLNNIDDKIGLLLNTNSISFIDNKYCYLSFSNSHEKIILREIASKLLTVIDK